MNNIPREFPRPPGRFLTSLLFLAASVSHAQADANSVGAVATDPASPAALNKFDKLNFRIGYSSDRPVRVRVDPFYNGKRAPAMNGGIVTYDAGDGEAYFWISFNDAVRIDRADVILLDDATGKTIATATEVLDVSWSGVATGTIRSDADWAQRLEEDVQRRAKEDSVRRDAKRRASGGAFFDAVGDLAVVAAEWMVPGYFILQAVALFRWKGGWRLAALLPLLPMALLLAYVYYATVIRDSNIAPVVIFFAAPVGFIYLALLWLLRRSTLRSKAAS